MTGVDWIALSFVQRAEDVAEAKKMIRGRAAVMAKIEKPQAIDRLAEIIEVADALMVARGDLGVELPLEQVPEPAEADDARLARRAGKPVVVATQMLESMITGAGADARRSLRRRHRRLSRAPTPSCCRRNRRPANSRSKRSPTMNRIGEEVERDPTYRCGAQRAAR